jgi:FkbM family methyltransferase
MYSMYEEYITELYERLRKITLDDIVVDIGAYIGDFTLKACSKVGRKGKVIAIEPSPEEYSLLEHNVDSNFFQNCIVYNIACGYSKINQKMSLSASAPHNPGARSIVNKSGISKSTRFVISLQRLDDVCKNAGIVQVDFLKIDAEGYGLEVLKGAEGLLKRGTYISMEIHLPSEREVGNYLSKLGYKQVMSLHSPYGGVLYSFPSSQPKV